MKFYGFINKIMLYAEKLAEKCSNMENAGYFSFWNSLHRSAKWAFCFVKKLKKEDHFTPEIQNTWRTPHKKHSAHFFSVKFHPKVILKIMWETTIFLTLFGKLWLLNRREILWLLTFFPHCPFSSQSDYRHCGLHVSAADMLRKDPELAGEVLALREATREREIMEARFNSFLR